MSPKDYGWLYYTGTYRLLIFSDNRKQYSLKTTFLNEYNLDGIRFKKFIFAEC